ncbi:MAG: hypothetical protein WDW36_004217 [Sanguina aurantia]
MTSSLPRFLTPLGSHTSVLEALVSSSRELRQDDAGSKRTPLSDEELLAAAHELVEACVNTPDGSGLSPLSTACMYGNTETITWLLTAGADPYHADKREGRTALHLAVFNGHAGCCKVLLEHPPSLLPAPTDTLARHRQRQLECSCGARSHG